MTDRILEKVSVPDLQLIWAQSIQFYINTGTFVVYGILVFLHGLGQASIILKLTILDKEYGPVLSNTHIPVSGSLSILFAQFVSTYLRGGYSLW